MSRTHFLRKNGVSTKYFSAFWEKFSLRKIALPQPDRCRLKQECHLSLLHHSSPWEKGCITDCCGAERRTRFSFLLSIMFPGSAIYITSSPSMSKQTCTMQHSQNTLLEARLPTLPIYPSPNFRENCCRRKKKSDELPS